MACRPTQGKRWRNHRHHAVDQPHYSVLEAKLRSTITEERQLRFDTGKLNNSNTDKAFKRELKNRFVFEHQTRQLPV